MSQPARVALLVVAWLGFVSGASCGDDGAREPVPAPIAASASMQDAEQDGAAPESSATAEEAPASKVELAPRGQRVTPLGVHRNGDVGDVPPGALACEGLLNRDFGMLTDATTATPKLGGYWRGAFAPEQGVADDRVELVSHATCHHSGTSLNPQRLVLEPGQPPVVQKIVADERWSDLLSVHVDSSGPHPGSRLQDTPGGTLVMTLRDGPGRTVSADVPRHGGTLELGALFREAHGVAPTPRLELKLHAKAGPVEVNFVSARVFLPAATREELVERTAEHMRRALELWCLPRGEGGLGLVDFESGRVLAESYDVVTGKRGAARKQVGFHTIHNVLIAWLRIARHEGWADEVARWTPLLERSMRRLLSEHFNAHNHLPFNRDASSGKASYDQAISVGSWIDVLLDAHAVLDDEELREDLVSQARRTADTLVRLAQRHDLDPVKFPNETKLERSTGLIKGEQPNWFGHMPNKITTRGQLDPPRRYNTAWAIVSGRSFWYHLLKTPAAVMRVHALRPGPDDISVVTRALEQYERPWDAARYDLENDTDDHYGYLMEDGMRILNDTRALPDSPELDRLRARAEQLVRGATEHRLESGLSDIGDSLWIQAIRLGTACAGDSPRAFKGLRKLIDFAPQHERADFYRAAILELAANDFKGRQLTNGQFTESFFKNWEMVCICFSGTYQGDCRERPLDEWQGDVGDIFGGPPKSSLEAQATAWRVASEAQRPAILARFATILDVSERDLLREYGFVYGLDPAVALQYELPEKYTHGLVTRTSAGLGTVDSLARALEAFLGLN
ncbi:MAG: hypothetical protein DHS20C15_28760 [Planctomycetota bacterium]|nr:MAG: hypothetical protein DHS20C15_28760 [Planctomycetota bacterium]